MFTKTRTAMLALAAVATLGLASLATLTSADARGFGGGGFSRGGGGGGMRGGGGMHRIGPASFPLVPLPRPLPRPCALQPPLDLRHRRRGDQLRCCSCC